MNRLTISILLMSFSTPAFAGGGSIVGQFVNLFLLLTVVTILVKKPLTNALSSRSKSIEDELNESQAQLISAQAKLKEVNAELENMGEKIIEMETKAKNEIAAMQKDSIE